MIRRLLAIVSLLSLSFFASPLASASYSPIEGVNCAAGYNTAVCADNTTGTDDPISGHHGVLLKVVNIISIIAGAAAIILLIVAGLRYVLSNGDSNSINGAKSTIVNALVGIIVIALARSLIVYVLGKI